eukprot:5465276-Prymnesium_polylepis.1
MGRDLCCSCFALTRLGPGGDAIPSSASGGAPFRPSGVASVTRVDDRGCLCLVGVSSGIDRRPRAAPSP